MSDHGPTTPDHAFCHLVETFALGMTRLIGARLTSLNARLAVLRYRSREPVGFENHPYEDVLLHIRDVARGEYDAYEYVTDISHLTYATTLLDTFLTDCTKFLLLLHPGAIGKNQAVTLEVVLSASTRSDILNQAAVKKVRELGYLPLIARVEFLKDTFGFQVVLPDETKEALEHSSGIRNVAVHDQGIFDPFLTAEGVVDVRKKTCHLHPTNVRANEIWAALSAYSAVVCAITESVVDKILKSKSGEWGARAIALAQRLTRRASQKHTDDTTEPKALAAGDGTIEKPSETEA